jgi:hypothetical protein
MANESEIDKTLRHMTENLNGAYEAVHPKTHPRKGKRCTCSGTAILACCYINGLGKVLLKGGPPKRGANKHPRPDFARFQAFLTQCMPDFLVQSQAEGLPPLHNGATSGDEWLYYAYRCAFVHGLPKRGITWGWNRHSKKYWFKRKGRVGLNIDQLVRGFHDGVLRFTHIVNADSALKSDFADYLRHD